MRNRRQAGFTLTELMVVVAILGILSLLIVSISSRPYGVNARTSSEQIVSTVGLAKLRASSTRRIHRIQVEGDRISVFQASTTGLIVQAGTEWQLVQTQAFRKGLEIWDVSPGAVTTSGASIDKHDQLAYAIDVRPDGQANASTVYLTDGKDRYRVVVYAATAGAHARATW